MLARRRTLETTDEMSYCGIKSATVQLSFLKRLTVIKLM